MTQRLIYGKTIKIQADSVYVDGPFSMDAMDDAVLVAPLSFNNTAYAVYANIIFGGQGANTASTTLICSRNSGRSRLEMSIQTNTSVVPTGTSLTLQIPPQDSNPFYPLASTRDFLVNLWNGSAVIQSPATISPTGLVTFNGLTGGVTYTFRYGFITPLYN